MGGKINLEKKQRVETGDKPGDKPEQKKQKRPWPRYAAGEEPNFPRFAYTAHVQYAIKLGVGGQAEN